MIVSVGKSQSEIWLPKTTKAGIRCGSWSDPPAERGRILSFIKRLGATVDFVSSAAALI